MQDIRDAGSISESEDLCMRAWHGNAFQYSCLENPMNRGAWQATVHRVTQSQTRLKRLSTHSKWGNEITEKEQKTCSVSGLRHFIKLEENQQNLYILIPVVILYVR